MKKEKIRSISHSERIWNIKVTPTSKSVEYINNILTRFSPQDYGITYLDICCEEEQHHKFSLQYKKWKNQSMGFYPDEDSGFIFFMEDRIEILLLKNSKLFNKLRNEFLKYFEILESKVKEKH